MVIRAGVVGQPISHSLSPQIHGAWFKASGLDGTYQAIECPPEGFTDKIKRLAEAGWRGVNVTIPHKARALNLADKRTEAAQAIGAANLLTFRDGEIQADNTDWLGFQRALADLGFDRPGRRAVVLGAGGAAAGILYALRDWREVVVLNRTPERAEALARRFSNARAGVWTERNDGLADGPDLLVNTTSLGMKGQPPLDLSFDAGRPQAVVDIVTSNTPLLTMARSAGVEKVQNGLPMLVYQAAPSFQAFTGYDPDPAPVLAALQARIA